MYNLDIVIPVKNSLSEKSYSIFFTLVSLLKQRSIKYKITVVDDNSTDKTIDKIKNNFNLNDIEIVSSPHEGVAKARNYGALNGSSEYILFIDDDVILYSYDTLYKTIEIAKDYDFACGALRYWTRFNWNEYLKTKDIYRSWLNILKNISYLPKGIDRNTGLIDLTNISFIGHYGIIRRELFEFVGGFPEIYKGWGLEDTHLMYILCLKDKDYCLLNDKGIKIYHLNHKLQNKDSFFLKNLERFHAYQKKVGIEFNEAAFFDLEFGTTPILREIKAYTK